MKEQIAAAEECGRLLGRLRVLAGQAGAEADRLGSCGGDVSRLNSIVGELEHIASALPAAIRRQEG